MNTTTETLDKLYLEYSQITGARTARELRYMKLIKDIADAKNWMERAVKVEYALAEIEGREPAQETKP